MFMFIIDFDDTLFDTEQFKQDRLMALEQAGVSREVFVKTQQQARCSEQANFEYTDERHARALGECGYDEAGMLQLLQQVWKQKDLSSYLFPDTQLFLEQCIVAKQKLILLSRGSPEWQKRKIEQSGIEHYFQEVVIVGAEKVNAVNALRQSSEQVFFINDKIDETVEIHRLFPEIILVLKKPDHKSEVEYEQSGLPYFSSLSPIFDYVAKYF